MRCTFVWLTVGVPDATKDVGLMTVTKDAVSHSTTFVAIGDGSYYFTYTESGSYTISYNGTEQDEFKDIQLNADDGLLTSHLASVAALGKIKLVGGELVMYTDGSSAPLHVGNIVNDLTTGGNAVPLSAAQGVALKALVDAISVPTLVTSVASLTTGNTLDGGILKDHLNTSALATQKTVALNSNADVVTNLLLLDLYMQQISKDKSLQAERVVWSMASVAGSADTATATELVWETAGDNDLIKAYAPYDKKQGDTKLAWVGMINGTDAGIDVSISVDIDGSDLASQKENTASYVEFRMEMDVSGYAVGMHLIEITLSCDTAAKSAYFKQGQLLARKY